MSTGRDVSSYVKLQPEQLPPKVWSKSGKEDEAMERPRIRHIAINAQDREAEANYYKSVFGLEEQERGPNGTIYLSDGHVGVAIINVPTQPYGVNHFGFQVESVDTIEERASTTAERNTPGAVGECWIRDGEGYRVDVSEVSWPI